MTGVFRFASVNVSLIRLHTNICKNGNLKKYINQINGFENNEKFSKALAKYLWCTSEETIKVTSTSKIHIIREVLSERNNLFSFCK